MINLQTSGRLPHLVFAVLFSFASINVHAFTSLPQKKQSHESVHNNKIDNALDNHQASENSAGEHKADLVETKQQPQLKVNQSFVELQQQLNLNETQKKQIRPILEEGSRLRAKVLEKHGVHLGDLSQLNLRRKIALGRDLKIVRQKTLLQLKAILSKEQLATYKRMSEAYLEQVKAKLKSRSTVN